MLNTVQSALGTSGYFITATQWSSYYNHSYYPEKEAKPREVKWFSKCHTVIRPTTWIQYDQLHLSLYFPWKKSLETNTWVQVIYLRNNFKEESLAICQYFLSWAAKPSTSILCWQLSSSLPSASSFLASSPYLWFFCQVPSLLPSICYCPLFSQLLEMIVQKSSPSDTPR